MELKQVNGINQVDSYSSQNIPVTHPSKLQQYVRSVKKIGNFIYNKEERSFIGRDGISWTKISLCYFLFYFVLGASFVAFLAIFAATLDRTVPRYYLEDSVMATRNKINPGLGFRPQIDTEDMIISYSTNQTSTELYENFEKLNKSLRNFLYYKYDFSNKTNEIDCNNIDLDIIREKFKTEKVYCKYDYENVLESTSCSPNSNFGYSQGPCVAIKLNRLYNWIPETYIHLKDAPDTIFNTISSLKDINHQDFIDQNIFVKCEGEFSADLDNLENVKINYYSVRFDNQKINQVGLIPVYYYPYLNQPGYKSPLMFVHFQNLPKNVLINVLCKAYAKNIDQSDKVNLRGMVKFQLFHGN